MPAQEIILDTTRHCIETASKKAYEQAIRRVFKEKFSDPGKACIEREIEALKYFLEHADFFDLRAQYSRMGSSSNRSVLIIPKGFEQMYVRCDASVIYPKWRL